MIRQSLKSALLSMCALCASASAHFVFVVPDTNGKTASVILSEDLKPDDAVSMDAVAGSKLSFSDAQGHETDLKLVKGDHACTTDLPANQPGIIHGDCKFGVMQRGKAKPSLLIYHPETIIGDPLNSKARPAEHPSVELVPGGQPGKLKLRLLIDAKPAAKTEVTLIQPGGEDRKVTTDDDGNTPVLETPGRYGAWARCVRNIAGEQDGKHYDEIREYATLVIDVPAARIAPMPQPASSFGAVACEGWLYVYGGHVADTHVYSTQSVSGLFHRLNLSDHQTWEELPAGPPLQGMNLAAWHGKIYRVGGMSPRNKPGEKSDVRSVADCACYDPASKTWTPIAPLPEPRSSHDLVVIGHRLIVLGGWNLGGKPGDAAWGNTMLTLDLSSDHAQWQTIKQPFRRRALIAAVHDEKLYAIGGFETEAEPSLRVDIYNPVADQWTQGPDLPGENINGFGPAACVLDGRLFVSVADGSLFRLGTTGKAWEKFAATTPRIVHRLVPDGRQLLVIGGADKKKQLDLIEVVPVPPASQASAKHNADTR